MSINNFFNKIKGKYGIDNTTIMYLFVVIGVGVSSFLLGRLSTEINQVKGTEVSIVKTEDISTFINEDKVNSKASIDDNQAKEKRYVASKNGKLYYTASCKGAQRIVDKNKIWFDSEIEAEKLGYTASPNCK